jgi:hypothetical protein
MPGDSGGSSDNLDLGGFNDPNLGADPDQPGAIDTNTFDWGSIGSSGLGNIDWGKAANSLLGSSGGGMGAGLALGLGALAAALTRQQAPAVKMPKYEAAPVYNRALTSPMFPPQPAPQKSPSGQNIYQPMKGMPLFFNPNPFQFNAAEAAKRYGPTPEQIAQGQAGYEAGLASLYKPMTIAPINYQTESKTDNTSTASQASAAQTETGAASGGSINDIVVGFGNDESSNYSGGGDVYAAAGRYLKGPGDGMSDSIKATIDHGNGQTQPARLARGEFVVPADVVSDLGNGSSDAGAQKLYDMMRKIRNQRHGTSKQPPAVKAEKAMPA